MKKSASEVINELETRIARLEVNLIQSKVGIKGFVQYLEHKLKDPKLTYADEKELKNMIDSFASSLRTYLNHAGRMGKLIRDIDQEVKGLSLALDQSENVMGRLKKQNDLNMETRSVSLSPSLEGDLVLKETNARVREILTEVSELSSSLSEKVVTIIG